MAEFDLVSIIIPAVIAIIIPFLLFGIKKFGQTSDGTLSGTIKLEHVNKGMEELEKRLDKRDEKMEHSFNLLWEKFNTLHGIVSLNSYRLDKLEGRHKNGNGSV